jgi:hypothetical protein
MSGWVQAVLYVRQSVNRALVMFDAIHNDGIILAAFAARSACSSHEATQTHLAAEARKELHRAYVRTGKSPCSLRLTFIASTEGHA